LPVGSSEADRHQADGITGRVGRDLNRRAIKRLAVGVCEPPTKPHPRSVANGVVRHEANDATLSMTTDLRPADREAGGEARRQVDRGSGARRSSISRGFVSCAVANPGTKLVSTGSEALVIDVGDE
jgi:hypothetical protein